VTFITVLERGCGMQSERFQSQACWSESASPFSKPMLVYKTEANAYKEFTGFLPPSLFDWG